MGIASPSSDLRYTPALVYAEQEMDMQAKYFQHREYWKSTLRAETLLATYRG